MGVNTIEYASVFMEALDTQLIEYSTTGWMEDNASQVQYHGGAEVKIPKILMNGLGNYDRDGGFVKGAITLNYENMVMTQDRGRTFQLDAMDVNENNFALVAGNVMGEFQRSQVIPEVDAYRYSNIYKIMSETDNIATYTPNVDDIFDELLENITQIRDTVGDGVEIVIAMSAKVAGLLDRAKGGTQVLQSGSLMQGNAELKVREIDGCPVVRVPSARFKTDYIFMNGTAEDEEIGGFKATDEAVDMNWIIAVRNAPIAVSKTDVNRIFDPMTNQNANAWKIDYRKYHDLWITDNGKKGIFVSVQKGASNE